MSYRVEPPYDIGANAKDLGTFLVERGSDAYLQLTVYLPDIDAPIVATSIITAVYMHVRTEKAANVTTYEAQSGMGGDITVSRPSPEILEILLHIPYEDTDNLQLGQSISDIQGNALRNGFPSRGYMDFLGLVDGDGHFIAKAVLVSELMVTRIA